MNPRSTASYTKLLGEETLRGAEETLTSAKKIGVPVDSLQDFRRRGERPGSVENPNTRKKSQ
ncbi:hypothetical protein SESBI_44389 [Sesbania bispinosa]|nr:hypothetical protein SESBI_44389 [Sesbania bispinosa]